MIFISELSRLKVCIPMWHPKRASIFIYTKGFQHLGAGCDLWQDDTIKKVNETLAFHILYGFRTFIAANYGNEIIQTAKGRDTLTLGYKWLDCWVLNNEWYLLRTTQKCL